MSLEADLMTALTSATGGLHAVVAHRVYPAVRPQGATLPCIVYQRISTPRWQAFGASQAVTRSRPRFQLTVWDLTAHGAVDVAATLRAQLLASDICVALADERGPSRDPDANVYRRDLDVFLAIGGDA